MNMGKERREWMDDCLAGGRWVGLLASGALAAGLALPARGQLLGQSLFPPDNPWNQNVGAAPVATNSEAVMALIGLTTPFHPDWGDDDPGNGESPLYGIPYNVVHGSRVAAVTVVVDDYADESDLEPVPIPAKAVVEGDYQDGPNPNGAGYNQGQRGDSHLIVWDADSNAGYELYGATRPDDPYLFDGVTPHTDGLWHAAQESVWYFQTNYFRPLGYTSADAAGLPILAGLARPDEGLPASAGGLGAIRHALRMTLPGGIVSGQYLYPASHVVAASGVLPFGARLRLRNSEAVNNVVAGMGPQAQILARAMQQYGLILADIGSAMYVTGTSASESDGNQTVLVWNMDDVLGLRALTAGDFDVVDLTPVVVGVSPAAGPAGGMVTITGQNFSGAAGQITVYFGPNPDAQPQVLGDSQISAAVPPGSGSVEVRVRSGRDEPDTYDGPWANMNEPIFGYGVSASSTGDSFVYTNGPVIERVQVTGGSLVASGVYSGGAGVTYDVLASTDVSLPLSQWEALASGTFDSGGNFSFTDSVPGIATARFYVVKAP